jgi:hypothetical protein
MFTVTVLGNRITDVLDFVQLEKTAFRKLDLLPSSDERRGHILCWVLQKELGIGIPYYGQSPGNINTSKLKTHTTLTSILVLRIIKLTNSTDLSTTLEPTSYGIS